MATKLFVNFLFSLITYKIASCNAFSEIKHNGDQRVHAFEQTVMKSTLLETSNHVIVQKRSITSDEKCISQNKTFYGALNTLKKNFLSDTKLKYTINGKTENDTSSYLQLAWGLTDNVLVVTTDSAFISSSHVYLSTDSGSSFVNIDKKFQTASIRRNNGVQHHLYNASRIYLVSDGNGYLSNSTLFISETEGYSFTTSHLPFSLQGNLIFNPFKNGYLMALEDQTLYVSKDNGKNWSKVKENVLTAKWGSIDEDTAETIYCTVQVKKDQFSYIDWLQGKSRDNDLEQSTDLGQSWTTLHKHVFGFGVRGKFLYVSIFLNQESEEKDKRVLEVSHNKGKSWYEVQLPSVEPERFYSILDMSDDMIMMHVDAAGANGYGTLYTSDATGVIYSESLQRHYFSDINGITDFYRVSSMRGVYITSQMDTGGSSLHTVITYDRGGEWVTIAPPAGAQCDSKTCSLQIHGFSSMAKGLDVSRPHSVPSAQGLILAHGHVGSSLRQSQFSLQADVYVTTDGGYTWRMALKGPHFYEIADQGGLLVAVSKVRYSKIVKFSTDEGNCWHEYTFTQENVTVKGLLTAPGNKEMKLAVWAVNSRSDWQVFVIDFQLVISKQCGDADYETWTPHDTNGQDGCLLGQQETFTKIKKDSWCHNMRGLDLVKNKKKGYCTCTLEDYDCDYGYTRDEKENCVEDQMFKGKDLDICERGHEEKIIAKGYHKIPGDKCMGQIPQDDGMGIAGRYILVNLTKVCVEGDRSALFGDTTPPNPAEGSKCAGTTTLIVLLVITLIVLCGVVLILVKRQILGPRRSFAFRRHRDEANDSASLDNCRLVIGQQPEGNENRGNNIEQPTGSHDDHPLPLNDGKLRGFHDDSDDDMLQT